MLEVGNLPISSSSIGFGGACRRAYVETAVVGTMVVLGTGCLFGPDRIRGACGLIWDVSHRVRSGDICSDLSVWLC